MTVTLTPVSPTENAVINAASTLVSVAASSDVGTITGGTVSVNGGTALALAFNGATNRWEKSVSLPTGSAILKITMSDSVPTSASIYINVSRSSSTNPIASINIGHPTEGITVRSPGVILQADVSRTTAVVRVEASVDHGTTWVPMAIPVSSGGS